MKKSKLFYIRHAYTWYEKNIAKLLLLLAVHGLFAILIRLPYVNLIQVFFGFLPYLVDWICILILFRPRRDIIVKVALILFVLAAIPSFVGLQSVSETLGDISYFMLATYVILWLYDEAKKR